MPRPHPSNPQEYREWVKQLEQKWLAGLIPDPQSVSIIVISDQGEILLQLRDNNSNIYFPNSWSLPGGLVDPGEDPARAAQRELTEETGLVLDLSLWRVYKHKIKNFKPTIEQYVFTGKTKQEAEKMILGEEQALHFFKWEELQKLTIAFDYYKLLDVFLHQRNDVG